jgi:hypothetical protein
LNISYFPSISIKFFLCGGGLSCGPATGWICFGSWWWYIFGVGKMWTAFHDGWVMQHNLLHICFWISISNFEFLNFELSFYSG